MNKGLPRQTRKLALAQLENPFPIYFQDRNDDQGLDMLSGYGQDGLPQLIFAAVKSPAEQDHFHPRVSVYQYLKGHFLLRLMCR